MTTRTIASGYAIATGIAFILGGLLALAIDRLEGGWVALAAVAIYAALGASFHAATRHHQRLAARALVEAHLDGWMRTRDKGPTIDPKETR